MSRVDETNAIAFNLRYPVGQPFRYYPIADEARFIETRTRSQAWTLGHGEVIVLIEGRTGGVLVEHLEEVPA